MCTPGKETGLTCIRRLSTSKVVRIAPGTCAEKPVSQVQILPYIGKYKELIGTKFVSNKKGTFIVVANGKVINRYKFLYTARNVLNSFKRGSRCIFEVKNGTVVSDPHHIAGYAQSPMYGFYRQWTDWYDIRRMHRIGALWYAIRYRHIKNVQGSFLVVVGDRVVNQFSYLQPAMRALGHHTKVSRCIFEVKGKKVLADPRIIAGYAQTFDNGFDKYWNNLKDINRMRRIATVWYLIRVRIHKIVGSFIVVSNSRVIGKYRRLIVAQNVMRRIQSGSRAVFEILHGKVQDPHVIAGIQQTPENWFNNKWNGSSDIYRMRRAATFWYADNFKNVRNVNGMFFVIDGDSVASTHFRLRSAINALRRAKKRSHCMFEVKNGIVLHDPRTIAGYKQTPEFGFDRYWLSTGDIHRMHHIARVWYARMYKLGEYLVVADKQVFGIYRRLSHAQSMLKHFKSGQRCILEVRNKKVVWNPHVIAGIRQTPHNHFNVKLTNLRAILRVALIWYADRSKKVKNVKGTFIVVQNNVAKKYNSLLPAMHSLRRLRNSPRCIFEVKNNVVQGNPHKIAGYTQSLTNGFDRYWRNHQQLLRMYRIAVEWWNAQHVRRVDDKKGEFLVFFQDVLIGRYSSLRFAQRVLSYYKHGRRAIFEVQNGHVLPNAHKIAGYPQTKEYGFDSKWSCVKELRAMHKIAKEWYHARWASQYVVVHGSKIVGPYYKIVDARRKLRGYSNKSHERRAIFLVRNGVVGKYPITAPGQYWKDPKELRAMFVTAIHFFFKRWRKYNAKIARVVLSRKTSDKVVVTRKVVRAPHASR